MDNVVHIDVQDVLEVTNWTTISVPERAFQLELSNKEKYHIAIPDEVYIKEDVYEFISDWYTNFWCTCQPNIPDYMTEDDVAYVCEQVKVLLDICEGMCGIEPITRFDNWYDLADWYGAEFYKDLEKRAKYAFEHINYYQALLFDGTKVNRNKSGYNPKTKCDEYYDCDEFEEQLKGEADWRIEEFEEEYNLFKTGIDKLSNRYGPDVDIQVSYVGNIIHGDNSRKYNVTCSNWDALVIMVNRESFHYFDRQARESLLEYFLIAHECSREERI